MPQYYLLPKRLAKRAPWTRQPVWLLEAAFFHLLLHLCRRFSFPTAVGLLTRLFGSIGYRNEKKRRLVRRNLEFALPELDPAAREQVVREVFRTTGRIVAELFFLDRLFRDRKRHFDFDIHPDSLQALRAGEPIIFAAAHVGAWQLGEMVAREYGLESSILYAQEANPWVHRLLLRLRQAAGSRMVPATGGVRTMLRELETGHSIGAAYDSRTDQGEMLPFFGVPMATNTTPARLSLRGYRLVPIRCVRLPDYRYRIEVFAPLTPTDPDADRRARARDLTLQLNRLFEHWIRETPGEWLCLKRRWPKTAEPAGSASTA